jgi:DNA-binding response OmpR family regulator
MAQLLELDGFEVKVVAYGRQALDQAASFMPDIFLVDYHLADIEGVDVVYQLRDSDLFANTPIVMASGRDVEQEALIAGADLFRIKPYDPGELVDRFFELIG